MTNDLPKQSLHIDNDTIRRLEATRIKKSIVPLILAMREKQARKIALLSWDITDDTRTIAEIIALSLAQNIEQKCAVVLIEGLKPKIDVFPAHALIRIPEVDTPIPEDDLEDFQNSERNFPIQIWVGPSLESLDDEKSHAMKLVANTDAQILLVQSKGIPRSSIDAFQKLTTHHSLNWLCVLPVTYGTDTQNDEGLIR